MSDLMEDRIERMKKGKMTKSQRKMLEYFESVDYKEVVYYSITQFAEAADMSEATVLRFCRSLGFKGYQDFKLNLASEMASGRHKREEDIEFISDLMNEVQDSLMNCERNISKDALMKTVELISSAQTICSFGVGHSYMAAYELHNRLMKMGLLTSCEQDAHFGNILVSSRSESDVLVLFSVSGASKDILEMANLARAAGMKIIAVTAHEVSPLSRSADVVLATASVESPVSPGAVSNITAQFFMTDVICTAVYRTDPSRFDRYLSKSNIATAGKLI